MPKSPRITAREAVRAFEQAGFLEERMTGSHSILKKAGYAYRLSIPIHKGKTLGVGLLKSQVEAAGLTMDEFVALLNS